MTKYARIVDSVAVEILVPPEGFDLADCVRADIVGLFTAVPDNVTPNSTVNSKGVWTIAAIPEPAAPIVTYPVVTPMTFMMLFKSAERISVEDLTETDRIIKDWWGIVNNPKLTEVDLGLESVHDALDYLITLGVLTVDRKAEILAGIRK